MNEHAPFNGGAFQEDVLLRLRSLLGTVVWPDPLPAHSRVSAVLILLCRNPETRREEILLIKKTGGPSYHQKQVAFPGGHQEPGDGDSLQTALREAREEIGLDPAAVEILGKIPLEVTVREVLIFPWVARYEGAYAFRADPTEVDRIFFLSLEQLLREGVVPITSPGPYRVESIGITVEGELVWGVTARLLKSLGGFVRQALEPPDD